jgi:protein phosphatase
MLLTITSTTPPATDLGYLLHKNPSKVQTFELKFGKAHVFYPEVSEQKCTAALLVEIDPVHLVRGQHRSLEQYVASSFTSVENEVKKLLPFVAKGRRDLIQPAIKCRGREYLRIIYGPEYTLPENLKRLRSRGLAGKRSLALREFALGIEALDRFIRQEPLYRVHECVFGVLALESEPIDPRL